jgi:hypothetical protein
MVRMDSTSETHRELVARRLEMAVLEVCLPIIVVIPVPTAALAAVVVDRIIPVPAAVAAAGTAAVAAVTILEVASGAPVVAEVPLTEAAIK